MSSTAPSTAGILTTDPAYLGTATTPAAGGHLLTVGAGQQYATLAAAIGAAKDGDVIAIQGGTTLTNDFASVNKSITIEGVGGMVSMVATVPPPNKKGILVIDGGNVTIKNISFSGVAISTADGGNGAGIRYDAGNLTLINTDFHGNQNGILANPSSGNIVIDHSTFENNGSGTGTTHDIYIGDVANFTLTNSVVASANVGHEIKSRAAVSDIEHNVIKDGPTGTGSYDIDIPNGGIVTIRDNYIEKGPNAENNTMVTIGEEGGIYANTAITISSNDFVNDHGSRILAINNATQQTAIVAGNSFSNIPVANEVKGPATVTATDPTLVTDNVAAADAAGVVDQTHAKVAVVDSAANVVSHLDSLQQLAATGHLASIALSSDTTVTVTAEQLAHDATALAAIAGSPAIAVAGLSTAMTQFILRQDAVRLAGGEDLLVAGTGVADGAAGVVGWQSATLAAGHHGVVLLDGARSQYGLTVGSDGSLHLTDSSSGQAVTVSGASYVVYNGGSASSSDGLADVTILASGSDATVAKLYEATFGRAPDLPGLEAWQHQVDGGQMSLGQVAQAFATSGEYQSRYGTATSDLQFIDALYSNVLGRSADKAGEAAWVAALGTASGNAGAAAARAGVLLAFAASAEEANHTASWLIDPAAQAVSLVGQVAEAHGG